MRTPALLILLALSLASMAGCAASRPSGPAVVTRSAQVGYASYYTVRENAGWTASGERYDDRRLSAAHRTLPFGTRVRVTNLRNGRSVVVRITDRGPHRKGRIIDVSKRAARELGFLREGTTRVRVEVVPG